MDRPRYSVRFSSLSGTEECGFELAQHETPEDVFCRTWARRIVRKGCGRAATNRSFKVPDDTCIVSCFGVACWNPPSEGTTASASARLGSGNGAFAQAGFDCIVTATRAFQRLLRYEVSVYASTDDEVDSEIEAARPVSRLGDDGCGERLFAMPITAPVAPGSRSVFNWRLRGLPRLWHRRFAGSHASPLRGPRAYRPVRSRLRRPVCQDVVAVVAFPRVAGILRPGSSDIAATLNG